MRRQLRAAQDITAGGSGADTSIRFFCPKNLGNLQEAIGLANDGHTYRKFCVSFFFLAKHM
jgi:hypothetical protein